MLIALVSRRPATGRTWGWLEAAVYIDLLATCRTGVGREVELQLALFTLGSSRIGKSYKG
jgi:hypothetical protein